MFSLLHCSFFSFFSHPIFVKLVISSFHANPNPMLQPREEKVIRLPRPRFPISSPINLSNNESQNTKSELRFISMRFRQRNKVNNKMVTPVEHVSIPHDLPEFFKIFHPEICYPQLRIPPAFIKFFNGDIPSICVLEDLAARTWKVVVERNDGDFFFMESWPDFVLDNNLEYGDFLTFSYAGNSKFYVNIYGKNGCLKQDVTALKEHELLPLVEENARGKSIVVEPADQTDNGSVDMAASVTSFEIVIKASHLNRARLNLPAPFGNCYLKRKQRPLLATLRNDSGSWTIVPQYYDRLELREGMQKFIEDNALRVNDVCRFKLIDDEKLILKVRIKRQPK